MARRRIPGRGDDGPTDADLERFGGVTRTCPKCRTEVYDDAELCWNCGHAFSGAPRAPKAIWIVTAIVLVVFFTWTVVRIL